MVEFNPEYYQSGVTPVKGFDKYLKYDEKTHTMTFIGDTLEVRVQKRYSVYDLLEISDTVKTLGIMDAIVDGKYQVAPLMLAVFETSPSDIEETVINNIPYVVLRYTKGDLFMVNTQVVQNSGIIYAVYMELISRGKLPYWFGYDDIAKVFDRVREMTGSGIGADQVIFELEVAHLSRSTEDLSLMYRYTKPNSSMKFIPIKSVAYAPTSVMARLSGSRFDDGLAASLQLTSRVNQPLEDLFRAIPPSFEPKHEKTE